MENDDQTKKFTFHHQPNINQLQEFNMNDAAAKENLSNALHNLSLRRFQESSLKSVSEENFTMSSTAEKTFETFATMTSSSTQQRETTGGGNEMLTDEDKKESLVSSPMMIPCAGSIGKAMFSQQQQTQHQKQQSSSMVTSSSSSSIASSMETTRKTKTLSFLHNEDLFTAGTSSAVISGGNNSLHNDEKLIPTASHLFRSISFQEQRRQCQKSTSLQRTESGGGGDMLRKMAILSPKHSLQELTEKIKQQQMRMQQQMYYGSSELSM
jgi:hypothetical protein